MTASLRRCWVHFRLQRRRGERRDCSKRCSGLRRASAGCVGFVMRRDVDRYRSTTERELLGLCAQDQTRREAPGVQGGADGLHFSFIGFTAAFHRFVWADSTARPHTRPADAGIWTTKKSNYVMRHVAIMPTVQQGGFLQIWNRFKSTSNGAQEQIF